MTQGLELLPEEVELELGRCGFTAQRGDLDAQLGDGLLLADDGLLEEDGSLLEGLEVTDLLQPGHEE